MLTTTRGPAQSAPRPAWKRPWSGSKVRLATFLAATSAATVGLSGAVPAGASPFFRPRPLAINAFTQTNLVSDIPG
jgi:hypothetical protein